VRPVGAIGGPLSDRAMSSHHRDRSCLPAFRFVTNLRAARIFRPDWAVG
jgi:hypothetical protein